MLGSGLTNIDIALLKIQRLWKKSQFWKCRWEIYVKRSVTHG